MTIASLMSNVHLVAPANQGSNSTSEAHINSELKARLGLS